MASTPIAHAKQNTRALSPPLSSATGSTIGPHVSRMNVVTRLAIEGSAKEGESVPIRMYLRLTIPTDSIISGSTIPLFKEENIKIVASEVHPLDYASTPYNFSSAQSPLLHNAARALSLPARLSQSYMILFTSQSMTSSRHATASGSTEPLDERYTGSITISGWQVSFVLPKELPPRTRANDSLDESARTHMTSKLRYRRGSIGEKNMLQFMAGISMIIPYLSRPPRAPWLLSIPTPRCLSNNLKLRVFPPQSNASTSSSYQSLSSVEAEAECPPWDVTADPHVTRVPTSRRSTYQYQHFADDEGSDSAIPGFSDDVGIQGTFPSTERIRIRWAQPLRSIDDGMVDGRRRVGVETVQGEMFCEVLGRARERSGDREGIAMRLEYKGSCKGVWFPGVATLLGMDVGLEVKGCDVAWMRHHEATWTIIGGVGYTGHDAENTSSPLGATHEQQMALDMPQLNITSDAPVAGLPNGHSSISRQGSTSSTASLLRLPLPSSQADPEYSFETTRGSEAGMSSVLSATDNDSKGRSRASSVDISEYSPSAAITLHLNMNDILPPNADPFTFTISGTALVIPRSPQRSDSTAAERAINPEDLMTSLPRFRVLAADTEVIYTTVRSAVETAAGSVFISTSSDAKARQTELKPGGRIKLSNDGSRVLLHTHPTPRSRGVSPFSQKALELDTVTNTDTGRGTSSSPTPLSHRQRRISSNISLHDTSRSSPRPLRVGELMIPFVNAIVTPLLADCTAYAVCLQFPAPAVHDSEYLEFFLAHSPGDNSTFSRLRIISATLEDTPTFYEAQTINPHEDDLSPFRKSGDAGRTTRLRVDIGAFSGRPVEIVYAISRNDANGRTGKRKSTADALSAHILLPVFEIPVGRLQVDVETAPDTVRVESNFEHQRASNNGDIRLCHYHTEGTFIPLARLHPIYEPRGAVLSSLAKRTFLFTARIAMFLAFVSLFLLTLRLDRELSRMRLALESYSRMQYPRSDVGTRAVTVTATILSPPVTPVSATLPDTSLSRGTDSVPMPHSVTVVDVASASTSSAQPIQQSEGHSSTRAVSSALLPLRYVHDWRHILHLDMLTIDDAKDALVQSLHFVWRAMRRLYHYPLPPP